MDRILRHFIVTPDFQRLHQCSDGADNDKVDYFAWTPVALS